MYTKFDANNFNDAFTKLENWLVGTAGWVSLQKTDDEFWLRNTGNGPGKPAIIGFMKKIDTVNNYYSFMLKTSFEYSQGVAFENQPYAPKEVYLNMWNNPMSLWVYSNTRRVVIVVKISSVYVSGYLGMILPFSLPDEYPFPLYVGGNYDVQAPPDISNSSNRMITSPGKAYYLSRDKSRWETVTNHGKEDNVIDAPVGGNYSVSTWPDNSYGNSYTGNNSWDTLGFDQYKPNISGEYPALPVLLFNRSTGELIGAMDGLYATPGFNRSTEQLVTVNNQNYRLFQNIYRSNGNDFFAIEET